MDQSKHATAQNLLRFQSNVRSRLQQAPKKSGDPGLGPRAEVPSQKFISPDGIVRIVRGVQGRICVNNYL